MNPFTWVNYPFCVQPKLIVTTQIYRFRCGKRQQRAIIACRWGLCGAGPLFAPICQPICMQICPLYILREGKASKQAGSNLLNFDQLYLVFTWFLPQKHFGPLLPSYIPWRWPNNQCISQAHQRVCKCSRYACACVRDICYKQCYHARIFAEKTVHVYRFSTENPCMNTFFLKPDSWSEISIEKTVYREHGPVVLSYSWGGPLADEFVFLSRFGRSLSFLSPHSTLLRLLSVSSLSLSLSLSRSLSLALLVSLTHTHTHTLWFCACVSGCLSLCLSLSINTKHSHTAPQKQGLCIAPTKRSTSIHPSIHPSSFYKDACSQIGVVWEALGWKATVLVHRVVCHSSSSLSAIFVTFQLDSNKVQE